MRRLPLADPGPPGLRSALRPLLRVARLQRWTTLNRVLLGILWMTGQALVPYVPASAVLLGPALRPLHGQRAAQRAELDGSCAALWRSWQSA